MFRSVVRASGVFLAVCLCFAVKAKGTDSPFRLVSFSTAGSEAESPEPAWDESQKEWDESQKGCTECGLLGDWFCGVRQGPVFLAEAMFLKYHRADGVRVGHRPEDALYGDYLPAPRFTLGYVFPGGLGIRARWWEFDHEQRSENNSLLAVDTYTVDLEVYERFCLNCKWAVEVSAGVRYTEFYEYQEKDKGPSFHDYSGWGGVLGLEGVRRVGCYGGLYARARGAILVGDKYIENGERPWQSWNSVTLQDTTQGMIELAFGVQYSRPLRNGMVVTGRFGYEWQNWYNFSSAFDGPPPINTTIDYFVGPSDVGFGGFVLALGVNY